MEYFVIPLAAFAASMLTLFSGFGLGTLLMPVVAIFFPVEQYRYAAVEPCSHTPT